MDPLNILNMIPVHLRCGDVATIKPLNINKKVVWSVDDPTLQHAVDIFLLGLEKEYREKQSTVLMRIFLNGKIEDLIFEIEKKRSA